MELYSNSPPPQYAEQDSAQSQLPSSSLRSRSIPRKPIALHTIESRAIDELDRVLGVHQNGSNDLAKHFRNVDFVEEPPALPPRPPRLNTMPSQNSIDLKFYAARLDTNPNIKSTPTDPTSSTLSRPFNRSSNSSSMLSKSSANLQKAFREARHFAGGLIHHPSESTKHFSILRHSHGLVFYQGTHTSLAVSIFSDAPMPHDRTLWLQNKGWSGKTGMRVAALAGFNGKWIDVTPLTEVTPENVNPSDERAWQRDIASFVKRSDKRVRTTHRLRETAVVRIPTQVTDGYFHLVLREGQSNKVLCTSPVFRVISVSASPSSMKGAGLMTLPLEVGVKALTTTANTFIATALPISTVVQNRVRSFENSRWAKTAKTAKTAYDITASAKLDSAFQDANNQYDQVRDISLLSLGELQLQPDQGPQPPYPVRFVAKVGPTLGATVSDIGIPSLNLISVPEDILRRLDGYYYGWTQIRQSNKDDESELAENANFWHQTIISALPLDISQLARVNVSHAGQKIVTLNLIDDLEDIHVETQKIEVRVMGFLRPQQRFAQGRGVAEDVADETEVRFLNAVNDVVITHTFLDQPEWSPQVSFESKESEKKSVLEKLKSGYVDTRLLAQQHIDKVPLHRVGLRLPVDAMRDKALGVGGIYIVR